TRLRPLGSPRRLRPRIRSRAGRPDGTDGARLAGRRRAPRVGPGRILDLPVRRTQSRAGVRRPVPCIRLRRDRLLRAGRTDLPELLAGRPGRPRVGSRGTGALLRRGAGDPRHVVARSRAPGDRHRGAEPLGTLRWEREFEDFNPLVVYTPDGMGLGRRFDAASGTHLLLSVVAWGDDHALVQHELRTREFPEEGEVPEIESRLIRLEDGVEV